MDEEERQLFESGTAQASTANDTRAGVDFDAKLAEVYGEPRADAADCARPTDSAWFKRWETATRLSFRRYHLPGGRIGKKFVETLAGEVDLVAEKKTVSERLIVFQVLILQRDALVKKSSDVRRLIERRLHMWEEGLYDALLHDAERCDKACGRGNEERRRQQAKQHTERVFHRLMIEGKVRSAVRWITERERGGLLRATDITTAANSQAQKVEMPVMEALRLKHPAPGNTESSHEAFLPYPEPPPMVDLDITGAHVMHVARWLRGGAGPGGSDSSAWQDWLLRYGAQSERLRDSVAHLTRVTSNGSMPWRVLQALMSSRLIALDKCPGVRPIGIGECLRRVMAKAVMVVAGGDVRETCGSDQLCSGLEAGIEAAIHAMNDLFDQHKGNGWGVLLVDASNAFNVLNRRAALWNARHLWPRGCRFLYNTYKGSPMLLVSGSAEVLYSREGVTQGDPLSMAFYALSVLPLIRSLKETHRWTQAWYADDANCGGFLDNLLVWFKRLMHDGPVFGYFPQPSKTYLVVDECDLLEARRLFEPLGVNVTCSHRLLGGHVGSSEGRSRFVQEKAAEWVKHLSCLSAVAEKQPHNAFAAYSKSLSQEWNYIQRVVPHAGPDLLSLEKAVAEEFLPKLFGSELNPAERKVCELPIKLAGLGVTNPTTSAPVAYDVSRKSTAHLVNAITGLEEFDPGKHREAVAKARKEVQLRREQLPKEFEEAVSVLGGHSQRSLRRAKEFSTGSWLSAMPSEKNNTVLSAEEFRDGLAMRYSKPLLRLPSTCDGCGKGFSLDHGLNCPNGGNVIRRHNEIRDVAGQLASMAYSHVTSEPVVREQGAGEDSGLVCDLGVRGVWNPQKDVLLDFKVVNTDSASYANRPVPSVLESAAATKRTKHKQACAERRADFTPFVCSTDGAIHREGLHFLRRLSSRLAAKWDMPYSQAMNFVRTRMSLAILRASVHCLRGARRKFFPLSADNGAAIALLC